MDKRTSLIIFISTVLILAALSGNVASAEDIIRVKIESENQLEAVKQIIPHAYTRTGNAFIAGLTTTQKDNLIDIGIEFEILFEDIDPDKYQLLRTACGAHEISYDLDQLGKKVDIGDGKFLMSLNRLAVDDISANHEYTVTPLTDLNIRWKYFPENLVTSITEITDFPTDTLVNLISEDSIYAVNTRLEAFQTRYIYSDSIDAARDWIMQKFIDWGYTDVSLQPFVFGGKTLHNVVAVKAGYAEPDVVIVIGGHYDSIVFGQSPGAMEFAPGSDDNGSGTAVTMELARVLANVPLRKTVIFIPFSAEEVGLVGSRFAAAQFAADETNIEVMYNYDMVGHDPDALRELAVSGGGYSSSYSLMTRETLERVTVMSHAFGNSGGSSDHQSFLEQGYSIVNMIETDFNIGGWHTNLDLTSRMDFFYLTEVAKMGLASVAVVANSALPTIIDQIVDNGDGQALTVYWENCNPEYTYKILWGEFTGSYSDSIIAAPGSCSQTISGITEGIQYFISVVGSASDGYPAIYTMEAYETPLIVPRSPQSLVANSEFKQIELNWIDNTELDLNHYNIYRQQFGSDWELLQDNILNNSYIDSLLGNQVFYNYKITSVDNDGYESDYSNISGTYATTFDNGILVVDEIKQGGLSFTQEEQEGFLDTIFGNTTYSFLQLDEDTSVITRGAIGQFSSVFWFDDDPWTTKIDNSEDTIAWYTSYPENILISGMRTLQYWGSATIVQGEIRYDEFGLTGYTDNTAFDFVGAYGQNGWPNVDLNLENPLEEYLAFIPSLEVLPEAKVIYTYKSATGSPDREGDPIGVLHQTEKGYRIFLAFPVTWLTTSSAQALISTAKSLFNEESITASNGDLDNSGTINMLDLVILNDTFWHGSELTGDLNKADVNGSCKINIADILYLVNYLYNNGPAPLPGCVE